MENKKKVQVLVKPEKREESKVASAYDGEGTVCGKSYGSSVMICGKSYSADQIGSGDDIIF